MGHDKITRVICDKLNLRAYTALTTNSFIEISSKHKTTPNAMVPLGRSITAAVLLSASLKPDSNQNLTYRIQGNGPLKEIHVQVDARGNIRAYVANPQIDLYENFEKVDFSKSIGAGMITVKKDIGMKEPYTSASPLIYGEIAMDTAYYLTQSEQIPSALILGLDINNNGEILSSGGILIQSFPDTPEDSIAIVEENIKKMDKSLGELLADGKDILSILAEILDNKELKVLSTTDITPSCKCNKEMLANIFKNFEEDDIKEMIEKDKGAEVTCTFCSKKHYFNEEELSTILKEIIKKNN